MPSCIEMPITEYPKLVALTSRNVLSSWGVLKSEMKLSAQRELSQACLPAPAGLWPSWPFLGLLTHHPNLFSTSPQSSLHLCPSLCQCVKSSLCTGSHLPRQGHPESSHST